jgi:hypothetical protein
MRHTTKPGGFGTAGVPVADAATVPQSVIVEGPAMTPVTHPALKLTYTPIQDNPINLMNEMKDHAPSQIHSLSKEFG